MNKTSPTNRLGMVALLCLMLGVGILFVGCGQAQQVEKKAVTKVETKAPVPAKAAPAVPPEKQQPEKTETKQPTTTVAAPGPASALSEIGGCEDLIKLQEKVDKMVASGPIPPDISAKIDEKRKSLRATTKVYKVSDALDLLECQWKNVDTDNYQFQWLFEVKSPIGHNCLIYVNARVDNSHAHLVKKDHGYLRDGLLNWTLEIQNCPPSSEWKTGDYILATSRLIPGKRIPYNIYFNLFYTDKSGNNEQYGEFVKLGWVADLGE